MAVSSTSLAYVLLSICLLASSRAAVAEGDSILLQLLGSRFTGLVRLLEEANLLTDLETEGHFADGLTVFAPSDHVLLDKVSPTLLNFLSQPGNVEHLRKVLLHHVVPTKLSAKSWYPGDTVTTLAGEEVSLYLEDGDLKVGGQVVKELGVLEADDGVVHAIQGFLVPEEVMLAAEAEVAAADAGRRELIASVELQASAPAPSPASAEYTDFVSQLESSGNYTVLFELLDQYNLDDDVQKLIADDTPFTLLAPDSAAFDALSALPVDPAIVSRVLLYHVSTPSYTYEQLADIGTGTPTSRRLLQTGTIRTLSGDSITVTTTTGADGTRTVLLNDVAIANPNAYKGDSKVQVQGLSRLLLPPSLAATPPPPPPPPPPTPTPSTPTAVSASPPVAPPPPKSAGAHSAVISWAAMALAAIAGVALL